MATQLLIYETAVPVSNARHGTCSVEVGKGFAFTRNVNSVPLMAIEFPQARPSIRWSLRKAPTRCSRR